MIDVDIHDIIGNILTLRNNGFEVIEITVSPDAYCQFRAIKHEACKIDTDGSNDFRIAGVFIRPACFVANPYTYRVIPRS